MTWVKVGLETYYRKGGVDWKIENGRFVLDVEVACNTTAEVVLPDGRKETVGSGSYHFETNYKP